MTNKWLISKNMSIAHATQYQKTNNPIKKLAEDLNRHFPKDVQMANRHVQICAMFMLNIAKDSEMQIKTTMRYHLTPVRMAIIKKKKITNNKCWQGCGEKGALIHCWQEYKLVEPLWKTVGRFLKKLKIELPATSLAVQWLRLRASNAGGSGSIPCWGAKIPRAAWHDQKNLK